jgi:hypothetical protein
LETGAESGAAQSGVDDFVGIEDAFGGPIPKRLGKDEIGIIIITNHHIVIAIA